MSRFDGGWVKLHREDVSLIRQRYEVMGLWATLLCMASRFEIKVWMNSRLVSFPSGSVVTSLPELAQSNQKKALSQVRRDLKFLESIGKIQQHTASEGRVISIVNWETEVVENDEKIPENSQKNRQTNGSSTTCKQQANDRPTPQSTDGNNSEKIIEIFEAADQRQGNGRSLDPKRQPIGEEEENKNKKEELKGDQSPSAPITPQGICVETTGRRLSLVASASPDQEKAGQQVQTEVLSTKAVSSKKKGKPPVDSPRFIAAYVSSYQKRYGERCRPYLGGKILGQIQQFLRDISIDRACELIQVYCQMDDKWFLTKEHDFSTFVNNQNKISNALDVGAENAASEAKFWEEVVEVARRKV